MIVLCLTTQWRKFDVTDAEYLEMLEAEHSMRCNDPDLFDELNEFEDMEVD